MQCFRVSSRLEFFFAISGKHNRYRGRLEHWQPTSGSRGFLMAPLPPARSSTHSHQVVALLGFSCSALIEMTLLNLHSLEIISNKEALIRSGG